MSSLPVPTGELLIPLTGELVPLNDPHRCAQALDQVRNLKHQLDDARAVLEDVLRLESERQGSKTLHLDGLDAVITGGWKTEYDEQELMAELRAVGMPEDRLRELVKETVTYRVDQRVAKSVAAANPAYAAVLERWRRTVPTPWRVTIERGANK
jgi:hypothetical protein